MKIPNLATYPGFSPAFLASHLSHAGGLTPLGALPTIHLNQGALSASYTFNPSHLTPKGEVQAGVLAAVAADMANLFASQGMPDGARLEVEQLNIVFKKAPAGGSMYVSTSSQPINWRREGPQLLTMQGRDTRGNLCFVSQLSVDVQPAPRQGEYYEDSDA